MDTENMYDFMYRNIGESERRVLVYGTYTVAMFALCLCCVCAVYALCVHPSDLLRAVGAVEYTGKTDHIYSLDFHTVEYDSYRCSEAVAYSHITSLCNLCVMFLFAALTMKRYKFNWSNPTGSWNLNLEDKIERSIMMQIIAINNFESDFSKNQSGRGDTSQMVSAIVLY